MWGTLCCLDWGPRVATWSRWRWHMYSVSPQKGCRTGPDCMCARVQVKAFDIKHLSKISLLDSGKHVVHVYLFWGWDETLLQEKWVTLGCFGFPHSDHRLYLLWQFICFPEAFQNIELLHSSAATSIGQEGLPWKNEPQNSWNLSAPCCKRLLIHLGPVFL